MLLWARRKNWKTECQVMTRYLPAETAVAAAQSAAHIDTRNPIMMMTSRPSYRQNQKEGAAGENKRSDRRRTKKKT